MMAARGDLVKSTANSRAFKRLLGSLRTSVRSVHGVLAEHWGVMQEEVVHNPSKSGLLLEKRGRRCCPGCASLLSS